MKTLLDVRDLTIGVSTASTTARIVNGVSYTLRDGESLGIIGESGSGKSAHILAMLGLLRRPPLFVESGEVLFEGQDLLALPARERRRLCGSRIGMIFQDPMSALNPALTIGTQLREPLARHLGLRGSRATRRASELLDLVGIEEPHLRLRAYPHQLSGGMRQRVMIAIAISCQPVLLIGDEATTALDASVQGEILDLILRLKAEFGMAVLWVTHDLRHLEGFVDTVQVMYAGRILERGPLAAVFDAPRNAYTHGLLRSLPERVLAEGGRLTPIPGEPVDPLHPPPGDPFAPRNRFATARCHRDMPPLAPVAGGHPEHLAAAWYDLPAALAAGDDA
ncbi:ABC transporter ATP-binding protein [Acetobacteraceae bacterium KSS8]|uniref:ABC transporter ATP-binding protein n=1 Tax=Endosaccharibacter trunci TaxID=2812733 RepID=A0ABT1W804_9PROT|nr:ABC transporter ATP-binding protein [Acetobacteraceae bacterium KSS8]